MKAQRTCYAIKQYISNKAIKQYWCRHRRPKHEQVATFVPSKRDIVEKVGRVSIKCHFTHFEDLFLYIGSCSSTSLLFMANLSFYCGRKGQGRLTKEKYKEEKGVQGEGNRSIIMEVMGGGWWFKLYFRNLGLVSVILGTAGYIKEQICNVFRKKVNTWQRKRRALKACK